MLDLYVPPSNGKRLTYRALTEHIKSLILSSQLPPGTRLPSVRVLAKKLCIASVTVQRAYAELAHEGYTWAATKGGTWVSDTFEQTALAEMLVRSLRNSSSAEVETLAAQGGFRLLGSSKPDPNLFDPSELISELADLRSASALTWTYAAAEGSPELVGQVIRLLASAGMPVSSEQIVLTMGATHAISLIASCLEPGSTVLLEDPHAGRLKAAICQSGLRTVPFGHDSRGPNLREIRHLLEAEPVSAIVISPLFHNPTGCVLSLRDGVALLELARDFNVKIVELDLYRPIAFEANVPPPLAIAGGAQVIYVASLTHSLAPGLRLGYIRCSDGFRAKLVSAIKNTLVSLPSFTQIGIAGYLAKGGLDRHLARTVPKYRARRDALVTSVAQYMPYAKATYPKGGFTSWVALPEGDYDDLEEAAVRQGMFLKLGTRFSSLPAASQHIRLGFGASAPDSIRESVKCLSRLVEDRMSTPQGKSA